ncbi:Rha family transcriptional regulator [Leucobacter sp. G161]|uniref:Rha family transcriptional regulator n=1 Tax=Leucobacter sp. G161 TaxID=663704 RepID=UPI00073BD109|nr:Rha family transcriptional regulator [Leucobacter sp. G161]KUF07247.1 hypothetical protein AUL38_10260 [Leucobacter sp. G161]
MSEVQTINIIEDADGELRVSSLIIAGRTENQHASVMRIVRDRQAELEEFGLVGFEIAPRMSGQHGGGDTMYALLNEPQSTLLMTFMRNSPVVVEFKVELVKQFFAMRQALASPQHALPQSFSEALRELAATVDKNTELAQKIIVDEPKVEYVDRFVGQTSDAVTVDVFASQFGSTGPKVRELLHEKRVAVRKFLGERWSNSEKRMVKEYEWRPRQGVASSAWFDLRPQHNAPRLHNGQVKQTMYVRQFHAQELAAKLGLEGVGA